MEKEYEVLINNISDLFGKVFNYNISLLHKSEDKSQTFSIIEVFDFYITSNAASFLKSLFYNCMDSKGILLNARCIIEGLALKKMCKSGDLTELNFELLKYQDALIEERKYKRFIDIFPDIFDIETMKKNYELSVSKYNELLKSKYDNKKIKEIMKSNIPFICNPNESYHKLIENYLGKNATMIYAMLSTYIHPNSNEVKNMETIYEILSKIIILIRDEYDYLNSSSEYDLKYYSIFIMGNPAIYFINAINRECKALEEIINSFKKIEQNNYVSNTLNEISILLKEMAYDKIYGMSEQTKCKFKCMIEMLTSFYEVYYCAKDSFQAKYNYKLVELHSEIMWLKETNNEYDFEEAYIYYKKKYPKGVSQDIFERIFIKTTGYNIDEKGNCKTLTDSILTMLEDFKKNNNEKNISILCDSTILDYTESLMVSHANGYMWFANGGAWNDIDNIFLEINLLIHILLKKVYSLYYLSYKLNHKKSDKEVYETINRGLKKLIEISKSIRRIHNNFNPIHL